MPPLTHRLRARLCAVIATAVLTVSSVAAESPAKVLPTPAERAAQIAASDWWSLVEEAVSPLRHPLGDRWPIVLWTGPGMEPLTARQIDFLRDRGLTQHLRMDPAHIPAAQALEEAGMPVIFMQGSAGNWPYHLAADSTKWAIDFDEGISLDDFSPGPLGLWHGAVPVFTEGWAVMADEIRQTLRAYRDAGVTVDGVWMDWEGDPYPFSPYFEQLKKCRQCRGLLPDDVLSDYLAWFNYAWRQYTKLHDAYLAAPTREIFPEATVTNWHVVYSSVEHPVVYFVDDRIIPPVIPGNFNASNPVAYGNDKYWQTQWNDDWPRDRRHVDQFYMHNLLRQVSADTQNRLDFAPYTDSFPWVNRWIPIILSAEDLLDPEKLLDMSRPAYREAMRHLWLRGITGIQLFNYRKSGYEHLWLEEMADATAVYDEVLAHAGFLDGEPLNLAIPAMQDDGVVWSGLRLQDRALLRAVSQSGRRQTIRVEAWEGMPVEIAAPVEGAWYLVELADGGARARPLP